MATPGRVFKDHSINVELFFNINSTELLWQIHHEFSGALNRLQRAYSIRDKNILFPPSLSPSQIIYGAQYDEINRTLVSVLAMRWIVCGEYETFVGNQPRENLLSRPLFSWLRGICMARLQHPADVYALLTYVVINDLGKDPQLASEYRHITNEDISTENHDIILLKSAEAGLVPAFNRLHSRHKKEILRGMQLGTKFNPGQLAQAENAPACLSSLLKMEGHQDEFNFHFIQQLLDIAGAAGHEDWTCAKKFIQPIAKAYQDVYDVSMAVILGQRGLRDAYDVVLSRRADMLHEKGLKLLHVHIPKDRAVLRLLCMAGVSETQKADLYLSTWEDLEDQTKYSLTRSLNIDGSPSEPAVQPTYMPAMLTQGVGRVDAKFSDIQSQKLRYMLRYLSRVMDLTDEQHEHAAVIERSVLWVVKNVVQGEDFQRSPACLENIEAPKSEILVPI